MTTALLDADIIAYRVASVCQQESGGWGEDAAAPSAEPATFNPDDVRRELRRVVDEWTDKAGAAARIVLLTGRLNFRKLVDPTYKGNRKGTVKPAALGFAKDHLISDYGAMLVEGLEADDLIGLMLTGPYRDGKGVAVSLDKDMRTLVGMHLNPVKESFPVEVAEFDADRYWMLQTLTGDTTDGYGGAPGIGPKKAEAALKDRKTLQGMWAGVVAAYASVGGSADDAVRTARLARILRRGDFDKSTQEVTLWHPSTPARLRLPTP